MSTQEQVLDFMERYGIRRSSDITASDRMLARKLIWEEYNEVMAEFREPMDRSKLAKELADLVYVTYQAALRMNIDLDAVVEAVHESNLSKLGEDGLPIYREDGKVLKGPFYFEPDIQAVLNGGGVK